VSSDTPNMWALTVVAPIVRFNALDIFATPTFLRASDFNSRISDGVHARLINFFLAISIPVPVYESRASNTSCLVINIRKLHNSDILCRRTTIPVRGQGPMMVFLQQYRATREVEAARGGEPIITDTLEAPRGCSVESVRCRLDVFCDRCGRQSVLSPHHLSTQAGNGKPIWIVSR
jgi:hypothetical protein